MAFFSAFSQSNTSVEGKKTRTGPRTLWLVILIIAVLFGLIYWGSETILTHYVNKQIDQIEGYHGKIKDIDLHFLDAGFTVHKMQIHKSNADLSLPFFKADLFRLTLSWRKLLSGHVLAEGKLVKPELNFVQSAVEGKSQTGEQGNWIETVNNLSPIAIDSFSIENGMIRYRNLDHKVPVYVFADNFNLVIRNLSNSKKLTQNLFAKYDLNAMVLGTARFTSFGEINPYHSPPTFDINMELNPLDVLQLNDFVKAYLNVDLEGGTFAFASEAKTDRGSLEGYVKPIFKNLKVIVIDEVDEQGPLKTMWESTVGALDKLFQNWGEDKLASKIPLQGDFSDPDVGILGALVNVFKNAVIRAFVPRIEHTINLQSQ